MSAHYEISPELYLKVAEHLIEEIGNKEFFAGTVQVTHNDIEHRLVATLIIRRRRLNAQEQHFFGSIERITPVWWDFHTFDGTEEIDNDFSFTELASIIEC